MGRSMTVEVKLTPAQGRFLAVVDEGRVSYFRRYSGGPWRFVALGRGVRVRSDTGERLVRAGLVEVIPDGRWARSVRLTPAGDSALEAA